MEQEIILKSIFEAFVLCSYVATGFCNSSLYFFFLKTASQLLTEPRGKSGVVVALRKTNSRRFCLQRRSIDELFYKEESIVFVASFHAISIIATIS